VKYCKKLAEKNAREQSSCCQPQPPTIAARPPAAARPPTSAASNTSKFALLMDDDSDDETAEKKAPMQQKKEEFPALQGNWTKVLKQEQEQEQCQARPTFASIAAMTPKTNPVAAKELPAGFAKLEQKREFNLAEYTKAFPPTNNVAPQTLRLNGVKCWADMEDDEDDEELTEYERDMQAIEQYTDRCLSRLKRPNPKI